MEKFVCYSCKQEKSKPLNGISTGYAIDKNENKICFECCAEIDKQVLRELKPGQRSSLYFSKEHVINWPGTLKIRAYSYSIKHNFTQRAKMVYFNFEGREFYGRNIGDMELFSFTVKKSK